MARKLVVLAVLLAMCLLVAGMVHAAEVKVGGYSQIRYIFWDSALNNTYDSFDLRRVRVRAEGKVNDDTTFRVQFDVAPLDASNRGRLATVNVDEIELKDAWIRRKLNDHASVRMGFASVPFGFEVPYSSARRLPLERSRVAQQLFPGERDLGLYFTFTPKTPKAPQIDVGYGQGLRNWYRAAGNGDVDTDSSALIARAQWELANKSLAGISYMMGDRTRTVGGNATKFNGEDVLGAFVRYNLPQTWAFQAEYFDGTILDVDVDGYYGMVEHKLKNQPGTLFYRYDGYDDGRAATRDYKAHTLGLGWELGKNERLTVQVEDIRNNDAAGTKYTNFGVQWQVSY
jgi:hypothetical protein